MPVSPGDCPGPYEWLLTFESRPGSKPAFSRTLFQHKNFNFLDPNRYSYAPAADGQRFLMLSTPQGAEDAPITVVMNWTGRK